MTSKNFMRQALATAALAGAVGSANAALTVYTGLTPFLAAVTTVATDGFTGFSISGTTPSPIVRSVGPYTYTATAENGFFGGGSTADPFLSTNDANDPIVVNTILGGASAIGGNFFASNVGGQYTAGSVTVTATDSLGAISSQTLAAAGVFMGSFLGFTSTGTITSLTVTSIQPGGAFIWPSIENLSLAVAVPEPGTHAMLLAGIGALGLIARRRTAIGTGPKPPR